MAEGYVYIAGAMLHDGWLQFAGITIADGGYLKAEIERTKKKLQ